MIKIKTIKYIFFILKTENFAFEALVVGSYGCTGRNHNSAKLWVELMRAIIEMCLMWALYS